MKKIFAILIILLLAASFSSCKARGEAKPKQKGARENVVIEEITPPPVDEGLPEDEPEEEDKPEKDERPEELVREMLEAVKTGEKNNIQKYVDYDAVFNTGENQGSWQYGHILKNLEYEILSSEVSDDNASVWVKVKNIDMGVVLPEFFNKAMKLEYDNALSDEPQSAAGLENEYENIFKSLVEDNKNGIIERLADIGVEKANGEWKIAPKKDMGNILLGGYVKAVMLTGENVMSASDAFEANGFDSSSSEENLQMWHEYPPIDEEPDFDGFDKDIID